MLEQSQGNPSEQGVPKSQSNLSDVLRGGVDEALKTDQYEVAEHGLSELRARQEWRKASGKSSFRSFYNLFEGASLINSARASELEKKELRQELGEKLLPDMRSFSPRIRDLYKGLLAEITGEEYAPEFEMTDRQLAMLKNSGDLALLQNPRTSMEIKINRMQTRIESELLGRKALDRRDKLVKKEQETEEVNEEESEEEKGQEKTQEPPIPTNEDESKPGMDEMERLKEGEEAAAIWTIRPGYGGYYKEKSFDTWDSKRNVWKRSKTSYAFIDQPQAARRDLPTDIVLTVHVPSGRPIFIPTPYTHEVAMAYAPNGDANLGVNGDDTCVVARSQNQEIVEAKIVLQKNPHKKIVRGIHEVLEMPAQFSEETEKTLEEIKNSKRSKVEKAFALASYTLKRLEYSNDSSYNSVYENFPEGYFAAIDTHKKADCDVANTYFAALCTKLGIPVRHVVGHMVKGKDSVGNSRITSGTGHAWTEVWNEQKKEWVRIDATPAGDPLLEEDQKDNAESTPGDYGEKEAVGPTDEELMKLEEKLANHTEKLSYTPEERQLSEATGVDLKEAREIVKEIRRAEDTRLPNGERVVDVLSQLFSLIIDSRKTMGPGYTGPLRKREGGEDIDDIVAHKIGIKAGDIDPASRQKPHEVEVVEEAAGGFDVRIIGDKSGSMNEQVGIEKKWEMQRRAEYLIFSSLHRFEQNLKRSQVKMSDPLTVRTEGISFRSSEELDVDKPLSTTFSPSDQVKLWHSLGTQGGGNGDVAALGMILSEIQREKEEEQKLGKKDNRLQIILACSDGMPDSAEGVHEMAQALGEEGAVVVGIGLTDTAKQAPIIFNTPFSKGDIAKDINDLPAIVAKHVVMEATKLFPEKTKKNYQKLIDATLAKFVRV